MTLIWYRRLLWAVMLLLMTGICATVGRVPAAVNHPPASPPSPTAGDPGSVAVRVAIGVLALSGCIALMMQGRRGRRGR